MPVLETDPIDLALDDDGDLIVTTDLQLSTGVDAVAQGIAARMGAFQGEWFLDLDDGVPYYEDILGQPYNQTKVVNAFRDAILSTPGVGTLVSLTSSYDSPTRTVTVSWEVITEFGDTVSDSLPIAVS